MLIPIMLQCGIGWGEMRSSPQYPFFFPTSRFKNGLTHYVMCIPYLTFINTFKYHLRYLAVRHVEVQHVGPPE